MVSISDIVDALANPYTPWRSLRNVEVVCCDGMPLYFTGNASVIFHIRLNGDIKILKCYTRRNAHLKAIYGEIIPEAIVDLPKDIFMVDGKLAEDILFVGSQVPMSDAQGNRMLGVVKEVAEETVKMDFNHPMAGKTLNFDVEVVEVRDVTPEDLASQGGCNCGCHGDCEGGCEGGNCGEGCN